MRKSVYILLFAFILTQCHCLKAQQQQNFPAWFDSVKLGIMIHYGLYSVPSYSDREQYAEWFYKGFVTDDTLRQNFVKRVYGDNFSYFDFTKYFKAELFDADQWIDLFKKAGAGYIVFSSKHHDGFCLWGTKTTDKNSVKAPSHRDFLKELKTACNKRNIRFGLYYSLMEWDNPIFRWSFDTVGIDKYVNDYLLPQFKELVDLYKPSLVFADGDWDFDYKTLRSGEMVNYLTEKVGKDEVIVNNRWGNGNPYGFLTPEYSAGINVKDRPWSECRSLARSFGLNRLSPLEDYLSAEELIKHFVQLVSMGGGLMLNVAPSADGQIPLIQQERLLQLGQWLAINGEAVYGSKPYKTPYLTEDKTENITASALDFDWVRNAPVKNCTEDNFSILWTNTYTPKKSETLTFVLTADDQAEVFVSENGKKLFNGTATKNAPLKFALDFKKGRKYSFEVRYEEIDVEAYLHLKAEDKDGNAFDFAGDKQWSGKVHWQQPVMFFTTNNSNLYAVVTQDLGKQLAFDIDNVPDKNMKITLLGSENVDLPWQYINGRIVIDLSNLTMADIKSRYAYVFRLEGFLKQ